MKNIIPACAISLSLFSCATKITDNNRSQITQELNRMVEIDQVAAFIPQGKYKNYTKEKWNRFKDSVFNDNKTKVESIYRKYGFLGFDKVGKDGSNNFWLLVQHLDKYPEFQKDILRSMDKAVKKGNANPNNYAYLYDRVKVNGGEKQLFGTQVDYDTQNTGRARPKIGLADSVNIDKLRREYGLTPLKEYLNQLTTMHFEMNKKYYTDKGIKEPDLY